MVCNVRITGVVLALAATLAIAACSVDNTPADPSLIGPSEFALSITLTAMPDRLPRDGSSQSVVTVTVRDASARPVSGQRLSVSTNLGTLSASEVVTGADGRATFAFVAPPFGTPGNSATIQVFPIGQNSDGAARLLNIFFGGASNSTAPIPDFTFTPSAPALRETVVFDATNTKDEQAQCGDACTYAWDFGDGTTATGRTASHTFLAVRTYPVTLTVNDAAGSSATVTKNVTVSQGTAPTASFAFSPSSPAQFEAVNFTAAASTAGPGRTITSYQWKFGDGSTATGVTTSHVYNVLGTYNVQLTVTDNVGLQASTTQSVTLVNGVTAAFNFSPTNPTTGQEVVFNAEESRGSSNGFGGRNPITKYIWHFGKPGDTSVVETTSPRATQSFPAAQTYRVTLTVEDSAGRRQTTNQTVAVN